MKRPTALTQRLGVDAVSTAFHKMGWYFREQSVSDFGIDAEVETSDGLGKASGKLIALQIKSGASYFRNSGNDYIYHGTKVHLEYWLQHSLPVFIILHNPETDITLWQRIEHHLVTETEGGWSIKIPSTNTLDERSKPFLQKGISNDPSSVKRYRFAADKADMERFRDRDVYFRFDVWVNKSLSIREIYVIFDDPDKDIVDDTVNVWAAGHTVHDVMAHFYPWLDYSYYEFSDADEGSGEIESHVFEVHLNEFAKAFLALEEFYQSPSHPTDPPMPGQEDAEEFDRMEAAEREQDEIDRHDPDDCDHG